MGTDAHAKRTEIKSMSLKDGVKELKTVTNDYKDLIKQLT